MSPKNAKAEGGSPRSAVPYSPKQLMSYIFQLQNTYLEEVHQNERLRKSWAFELDRQAKLVKSLMKEKTENEHYRSYSSLMQYLDFMEPHELMELIKNAKDFKQIKIIQKNLDDLKRTSTEKIERLMREKESLQEEISLLKADLDNTRNESAIYLQ